MTELHFEVLSKNEIPVLDFVALTDPCYVVGDINGLKVDIWRDKICETLFNDQQVNEDVSCKKDGYRHQYYPMFLKYGDAELYIMFGDTAWGDGSFNYGIENNKTTFKINTSVGGDLCVDAGVIGVASWNKEAEEIGLSRLSLNSGCVVVFEKFGEATKITFIDREDHIMTFGTDKTHPITARFDNGICGNCDNDHENCSCCAHCGTDTDSFRHFECDSCYECDSICQCETCDSCEDKVAETNFGKCDDCYVEEE